MQMKFGKPYAILPSLNSFHAKPAVYPHMGQLLAEYVNAGQSGQRIFLATVCGAVDLLFIAD